MGKQAEDGGLAENNRRIFLQTTVATSISSVLGMDGITAQEVTAITENAVSEDSVAEETLVAGPIGQTDYFWNEKMKLAASDGDDQDEFGRSVAISKDGTTALIGAPTDDEPNGTDDGSAYVFSQSDGAWTEETKLSASDSDGLNLFGYAVALSADGSTALIGARDRAKFETGSAYVFKRANDSWEEKQRLTHDIVAGFGSSVSLSDDGSMALVGARKDKSPVAGEAGTAYVFLQSGGSWNEETELFASDGDPLDLFGAATALSGDGSTALIGAPGDNTSGTFDSGSAYIFSQSEGSWNEEKKVTVGFSGDSVGSTVALSEDGSTALIGAPGSDSNGESAGSVHVFSQTDDSWVEQKKLVASDGDAEDAFGSSVSLSRDGSIALIGADYDEDASSGAGSAYVFTRSDDSWTEETKLIASDSNGGGRLGSAVALSDDVPRALIGAKFQQSSSGAISGAAYVYEREANSNSPPTADAGPTQTAPPADTITLDGGESDDSDGDSLSYSWAQTSGPDVSLTGSDTTTPEFTAPEVDSQASLTFELTVNDGKATDTDTTTVIVSPLKPIFGDNPPLDIDSDNNYEDIDGDGEFTIADVEAFFEHHRSEIVQENAEFFNFSNSDPEEVNLDDVQALYQQLVE
jgi:hypothetical protein